MLRRIVAALFPYGKGDARRRPEEGVYRSRCPTFFHAAKRTDEGAR